MKSPVIYPGLILALLLSLTACEQSPFSEPLEEAQDDTAYEHAMKHADPTYVCPMHSQIVRDKPASCPICGMDLVPVETDEDLAADEREILYWVAPMDPAYRRDEPGKSPMGMDLVPVYADEVGATVKIKPEVEQHLGIRTADVVRDTLWKYIKTVGVVTSDEDMLSHVHPRASGWIEKTHVRALGDRVKKGDVLFEYYAPEIVQAQDEYLVAKRSASSLVGNSKDSLMESARVRLELLQIPRSVIRKLEKQNKVSRIVPVLAPRDGYVTQINVREGMYITPQLETYTITDLSSIWVRVDVFEHQLDWVEPGKPAEVRVEAIPGKSWEGKVDYIYPELTESTRTLNVRLRFDNPDGLLKPNMFADVVIYGGPKRDALVIPREALIRGSDDTRVIRRKADGSFEPVVVVTGIRSGEKLEILAGLEEGDQIVTSGQFLIDSESNLKASLMRMSNQ
jgi:Cu(I)/Ag(I) efflux system membrane fusion protein